MYQIVKFGMVKVGVEKDRILRLARDTNLNLVAVNTNIMFGQVRFYYIIISLFLVFYILHTHIEMDG